MTATAAQDVGQDLMPCLARRCPQRIGRGALFCDPHLEELPEGALDAITLADPGTAAYLAAVLAAIGYLNGASA